MYSVSAKYLATLNLPYKTDKISGFIKLRSNERIDLTDANTIQNKLTITKKACGSSFAIGTFNASQLTLGIIDNNAKTHDFGGAVVYLEYSLRLFTSDISGVEEWETVPLGYFYIDGQETTRLGNQVTLHGYDLAQRFDVNLPSYIGEVKTLWTALVAACEKAVVGIGITEDEFNLFVNSHQPIDCTDKRIQSCRDLVMWIAQATNTIAFIDRNNMLMLKQYIHAADPNRTFVDREIESIKYSDTLTYTAYLTSYLNNEPVAYSDVMDWSGDPDANFIKEGALALKENPLFKNQTEEVQDEVNRIYLGEGRYSPTAYVKADIISDAAIDLYDTIGFETQLIDNEINRIDSVCTQIKWKYRGKGSVVCQNIDEYTEDANSARSSAAVMTVTETVGSDGGDIEAYADTSEHIRTPPKSQIEKRIDALESGAGGAYTTAINFRSGGFDLTFMQGGKEHTNAFTVEEDSAGNITKIINTTSGKEIAVTYE